MNEASPTYAELRQCAVSLRLHGLQAHRGEVIGDPQGVIHVALHAQAESFQPLQQ